MGVYTSDQNSTVVGVLKNQKTTFIMLSKPVGEFFLRGVGYLERTHDVIGTQINCNLALTSSFY